MPSEDEILDDEAADFDDTVDLDESGSDRGPVPHKRFAAVNAKYRAYAELGTPEEVADALIELNQLKSAFASGALTETKEVSTPATPKPTGKEAQAINRLFELIPGLADLPSIKQAMGDLSQQTASTIDAQAQRHRADAAQWLYGQLIEDSFIHAQPAAKDQEANEDTAKMIEDLVADQIFNDAALTKRFNAGDQNVVKTAYAHVKKVLGPRLAKVTKRTIPSHLGGYGGMPSLTGSGESKYTPAQLKEMGPRKAREALNKEAFDTYNQIANSRQEG